MAITAESYLGQLRALLPPGSAWLCQPGSAISKLLLALADELVRMDLRARTLVDEADPRSVFDLLSEWEGAFGLPAPCLPAPGNLEQRLAALFARVTGTGGQSRQYFIDLAADLGYTVTITEFDAFTVDDTIDLNILGDQWNLVWQINAPQVTVTYMTVASDVGTPLAYWGNELLECALSSLAPAHTHLQFSYS